MPLLVNPHSWSWILDMSGLRKANQRNYWSLNGIAYNPKKKTKPFRYRKTGIKCSK
jgi:hypothetical protein